MNLFPAAISEVEGNAGTPIGDRTIPLRYDGPAAEVVFGIRPEDLYEAAPPNLRTVPLPATVVTVEPLGAETILGVQPDGIEEELLARVGRDSRARAGAATTLHLDLDAIHLFDATTGAALG